MNPDVILFDFFGTLVDYSTSRTEQGYASTHAYLRESGIEVDYETFLRTWDECSQQLDAWSADTQREYSMAQVVEAFARALGIDAPSEEFTRELIDHYIAEWCTGVTPVPGVVELIEDLSARFRLAVVSNTHHLPLVPSQLASIGVPGHFEQVITSIEHGRPKPHPSIYAAALGAMDAAAEKTLFVGDSFEADYLGPRRAGMEAILITDTPPAQVEPDRVIAALAGLRDLL